MLKIFALFAFLTFSSMTHAEEAVLYYSPSCGHCKKVLAFLNEQHKTLDMKNVTTSEGAEEFRKLGRSGVPTMVIGSKVLVGDTEIINYLKDHPEILRSN